MEITNAGALLCQTMMALTLIFVAAKIGGAMMGRLGQPPVLGELLAGVILGNLTLIGIPILEPIKHSVPLQILGEIGAILLLFEVGIESNLGQLLSVGSSSLLVALLGVIAPMILGYFVSSYLAPNAGWLTHLFVGGTLTATSVGISARVLKDLGMATTKEARIILGAAVADDIIGLLVFAVLSALTNSVQTQSNPQAAQWMHCFWTVAKACLFLFLALLVGRFGLQRVCTQVAKLEIPGAFLGFCVCFCFALATLAWYAGLAPIVGGFAAGLMLEEAHFKPFIDRGERSVQELLFPIATLIVPVFFVLMGMHVDLTACSSSDGLKFAFFLTLAAAIGKQLCALGVLERGVNRLVIGVGMIPRGEVGLIFAGLGSTLISGGSPVLSHTMVSGLIIMVMLTTLMTPSLLKAVISTNQAKKLRTEEKPRAKVSSR